MRGDGAWRWALVLLVLGSVGTSPSCMPDFEPKSKVLYTRILAVRSDQPRLSLGQRARLDALVVSTDDSDAIELTWELCPFTASAQENFACVYPPALPAALVETLRGSGETFDFTFDLGLLLFVDAVCARQEELQGRLPPGVPLPDCGQGYPARVRLTATNVTTGEAVAAVKTLNLLPSQGDASDNENPALQGLTPDAGQVEPARVGEGYKVRCAVEAASLETFTRVDDDEPREEELLLSWFVRNGRLDKDLTLYSAATDREKAQRNEVVPEGPGQTTVWCVARDGRGGSDWHRLELEVVD